MISLIWVSRHKGEDLHAAYELFLFIGICSITMESSPKDPVTFLLPLHGKNYVYAFTDCSIQYLHALTFSLQCISLQRGKFFFRLHGLFLASYHDGYNHLLYDLGQVCGYFLRDQLTYPAIYYLLVGVMTYIASHLSRGHLPYHCLKLQWGRLHCDHLGDYWYLPAPQKPLVFLLFWC